jgi:hypothetical protein
MEPDRRRSSSPRLSKMKTTMESKSFPEKRTRITREDDAFQLLSERLESYLCTVKDFRKLSFSVAGTLYMYTVTVMYVLCLKNIFGKRNDAEKVFSIFAKIRNSDELLPFSRKPSHYFLF